MTIETRIRFYYIDPITADNNLLNFIEPDQQNIELTATLLVGARTHTSLATEISRALNDVGLNTYTVAFNRAARSFTISADGNFNLLVDSGSNAGLSPFSLIGFSGDQTGGASYTGDAAGSNYQSQFVPQSYLGFEDNLEGLEAKVNESGSGITEIVTFGERQFTEFNLPFITNEFHAKGSAIRYNPTGLSEARALMTHLIRKREAEIMLNESDVNEFEKVLLESTPESRQGIAFALKEQVRQRFNKHYETGILRFRKQ